MGRGRGKRRGRGAITLYFPTLSRVFAKLLFFTRSAEKRGSKGGPDGGLDRGPNGVQTRGSKGGSTFCTDPSIVTVEFKLHCTCKELI